MQQVYRSNPYYNIADTIQNTQVKFFVTSEGRLNMIIWYSYDGIQKNVWGNPQQKKWDLSEANENDLKRAFGELALKNPKDFRALYYTLKEHDDVTFPSIQETLHHIQETFNFN